MSDADELRQVVAHGSALSAEVEALRHAAPGDEVARQYVEERLKARQPEGGIEVRPVRWLLDAMDTYARLSARQLLAGDVPAAIRWAERSQAARELANVKIGEQA